MKVFTETHLELAMQRAKWLRKESQSCSVVATLIISVVFATMATVPGGLTQEQQERGLPVYKGKLALNVFSVSSLCFSSTPPSCSLTFSILHTKTLILVTTLPIS
eukprot:TRINITY_DN9527_c0_g1_i1.p1 TRINITY_DN9527_c0_g1~~TRINITY_DN9527_c0_g1_i1.p1  ORF type:complete len:119 (-),score=17.33 TRINITY_DN9527_c0_g1_i1:315-629(-)